MTQTGRIYRGLTSEQRQALLQEPDPHARLDRLLALGASRFEPPSPVDGLVVLQDPEGNEFCLT